MLIFNVFTKVQAGLFGAFAAFAAPSGQAAEPVEGLEQVVESEDGAVSDPGLEFTDEVDETAAREWRCYDDGDWKRRGYCLAKCEDKWDHDDDDDKGDYVAVSDKMRVRGNRDWCERRARKYCKRRGDRLDRSCFGDRKWDDDNHDDDDDDNDNHGD